MSVFLGYLPDPFLFVIPGLFQLVLLPDTYFLQSYALCKQFHVILLQFLLMRQFFPLGRRRLSLQLLQNVDLGGVRLMVKWSGRA